MAGVVLAMLGFQALTRKVEGQHYVSAALITTAGLIVIGWKHGVTLDRARPRPQHLGHRR